MSARTLNASLNVLQGVLAYKRDRQTHANDLAQQAVNNETAKQQGELALNSLATSTALARRKLAFDFLDQQKQAMQAQGSAAVQAAWAGIEGGTANDIMTAVMQEAAQGEVERDEGLRAIHAETVARTADIVMQTSASMDHRRFNKPDVLANILGIGKNIIDDNRKAGAIG